MDILSGRESVRGTSGGNQAVTVQSGDATLAVGSGALPEDTAIDVSPGILAAFLPSGGGLVPLEQVRVDFSGKVLGSSAQLSVAVSGGVTVDDTLLVAEVVRVSDVPHLMVVALAQVVADRIVSKPAPGLPGIVEGGDYVFYRSSPVGFVSGITSSTAGPVKSVVTTNGLPFIGYARNDGRYVVAALPGSVIVGAQVPKTSLVGSGNTTVVAGETASLALSLTGQVTTATVSPADSAVAVPTSIQVQVDSSAALNPATAIVANVSLSQTTATDPVPVSVRLILSGSGRSLAVIPESALLPATRYAFSASGLADVFGGLVQVPSVSFTRPPTTATPSRAPATKRTPRTTASRSSCRGTSVASPTVARYLAMLAGFDQPEQLHPPLAGGTNENIHRVRARQKFSPRTVGARMGRPIRLGARVGGLGRRQTRPRRPGRGQHARVLHGVEPRWGHLVASRHSKDSEKSEAIVQPTRPAGKTRRAQRAGLRRTTF